jgi:hypothetical protein
MDAKDAKDAKEIYDKCKNTKNRSVYEIILQWYLISSGFRDVALICLDDLQKPKLDEIKKFLGKNKIIYKFFPERSYLILYNPRKFNIDKLDKTFGKLFGQQLGCFYCCATNDVSKNHYRVVISVNKVEICAQMCKKDMIAKNISKYYKIYLEISEIFKNLDKTIFGKLETYEIPKQHQ